MISITSGYHRDLHWSERDEDEQKDKIRYIVIHPSLIQIDRDIHPFFGLRVLTDIVRDYVTNAPLLSLSCFSPTWISIVQIYQMLYSVSDDKNASEEVIKILESCCRDEQGNLFSLGNLGYGMQCNLRTRYNEMGLKRGMDVKGIGINDPRIRMDRFLRGDVMYTSYIWKKGLQLRNSMEMKFSDEDPIQPMARIFLSLAFGNLSLLKEVKDSNIGDYPRWISSLYSPFLQEFVTPDVWNYLHESGDVLNASLRSNFSSPPSEPLESTHCQWGMIEYIFRKHCEVLSVDGTRATVRYEGKNHALRLVTCTATTNGVERRYGFYMYGNGAMLPSCYILLMIAHRFLTEEARREYVEKIQRLIEIHFGLKGDLRDIWKRDRMGDFFTPPVELEKLNTMYGSIPDGF